jgi:hypothetical protein
MVCYRAVPYMDLFAHILNFDCVSIAAALREASPNRKKRRAVSPGSAERAGGHGGMSEAGHGEMSEAGHGEMSETGHGEMSEAGHGEMSEAGHGEMSEAGHGEMSEAGQMVRCMHACMHGSWHGSHLMLTCGCS